MAKPSRSIRTRQKKEWPITVEPNLKSSANNPVNRFRLMNVQVFPMSKFICILFLFFSAPCFAQQQDSLRSDTLNIPSLNLMLIKQNHHIINKDGKETFYKTWTGDSWPDK